MMHVGFFTECYHPIVNGIVASIDALRDGLHARGIDVTTIAPYVPDFDDERDDVVRIPSLPLPTPTAYRLCVPYMRANDRRRVRGIDVAHAHSPFVTGWMAASYARRHGIPLVFTYHTRLDAYAHYAPFDRASTERAMIELTRRYANGANAVVVPTHAMETRLRDIGVRSRIVVVPSGIDVERFAAGRRSADIRAQLGGSDGVPLALVVSRLGAEKNVELAIDAVASLPDVALAIVGEGPQRGALEDRARRTGIGSRVRFAGRARTRGVARRLRVRGRRSCFRPRRRRKGSCWPRRLPRACRSSPRTARRPARYWRAPAASCRPTPALSPTRSARRSRTSPIRVPYIWHSRAVRSEMQTRRILELYQEVLAARAA